ncbi:MAG TPA: hypothetical protein VI913_00615 [Candidatus Peribacteraceae bacterium]|nr:hypothetical protein [Candidatus Peribacteraceae bacterium]
MSQQKLHPGQDAPFSGQYAVIGQRGAKTGNEITSIKGKPLPPTPRPGMTYRIADKTK